MQPTDRTVFLIIFLCAQLSSLRGAAAALGEQSLDLCSFYQHTKEQKGRTCLTENRGGLRRSQCLLLTIGSEGGVSGELTELDDGRRYGAVSVRACFAI
ncbi:hypothetical protein GQ53DRAFT_259784 [Thozetella sp. PMI_491]|nr:hypothetical protein GQ53DRAFT_259784 [Thozetella sp. PMI_491]